MIQLCWYIQGLLIVGQLGSGGDILPLLWLCSYTSVKVSGLRVIIDLGADFCLSLLGGCFLPWFLFPLWSSDGGSCG